IAQELGDKSGDSGAAINIAHIHQQQGDLKSAEAELLRADPVARSIGERAILSEAMNSLGEIKMEQANFAEARSRFQEALTMRQDLGDQLGLAESRESVGQLNIKEGKPADAEKLLLLAREQFHKAESQDQEISTVGDLAHALVDQGRTADAMKAVDSVKAM